MREFAYLVAFELFILDKSEEKHEPVSDIDTVAVDSLKVLDPKRPIREAEVKLEYWHRRLRSFAR